MFSLALRHICGPNWVVLHNMGYVYHGVHRMAHGVLEAQSVLSVMSSMYVLGVLGFERRLGFD